MQKGWKERGCMGCCVTRPGVRGRPSTGNTVVAVLVGCFFANSDAAQLSCCPPHPTQHCTAALCKSHHSHMHATMCSLLLAVSTPRTLSTGAPWCTQLASRASL